MIVTKKIVDVRVGDWVSARNPEVEDEECMRADDAIRPEDDPWRWRRISLRLAKARGGYVDIELLRPLDLIQENHLSAGDSIEMEVMELGVDGFAQVLSEGACPEIGARPAPGCRVVTATYAHSAAPTFDLTFAGVNGRPNQTIDVTGNHPI